MRERGSHTIINNRYVAAAPPRRSSQPGIGRSRDASQRSALQRGAPAHLARSTRRRKLPGALRLRMADASGLVKPPDADDARVPVTVLTGFLGSGFGTTSMDLASFQSWRAKGYRV